MKKKKGFLTCTYRTFEKRGLKVIFHKKYKKKARNPSYAWRTLFLFFYMYCTEVNFKIVCLARRMYARLKIVPARAASPGRPVLPALLIETFRTPAAAARAPSCGAKRAPARAPHLKKKKKKESRSGARARGPPKKNGEAGYRSRCLVNANDALCHLSYSPPEKTFFSFFPSISQNLAFTNVAAAAGARAPLACPPARSARRRRRPRRWGSWRRRRPRAHGRSP